MIFSIFHCFSHFFMFHYVHYFLFFVCFNHFCSFSCSSFFAFFISSRWEGRGSPQTANSPPPNRCRRQHVLVAVSGLVPCLRLGPLRSIHGSRPPCVVWSYRTMAVWCPRAHRLRRASGRSVSFPVSLLSSVVRLFPSQDAVQTTFWNPRIRDPSTHEFRYHVD